MSVRQRLIGLLPLLLLVGCGPRGPATYPVSGAVTFDNQPLQEGDIFFLPADPALATEGGKIVDGKFRMVSKPGTCRVKIPALNINEDTECVSGSPIAANYIPAQYNDQTTLTA